MPLNILLFYFRQAEWAACIDPQNNAIVPIKYQEQVREEMVNPLHSNNQDLPHTFISFHSLLNVSIFGAQQWHFSKSKYN